MTNMKLNCDLGESFGHWQLGNDQQLMPFINMANIACGFHAGDPSVIKHTLQLAKQHHVVIGAHPSYPDLQGFGRRSLKMSRDDLIACIQYQIAALDGLAKSQKLHLDYVKPHGALYNDMMVDNDVFDAVLAAVAGYYRPLKLMIQATPSNQAMAQKATDYAIELLYEAFSDRAYTKDGNLVPRTQSGAVLSGANAINQVKQLIEEQSVTSICGEKVKLNADTLCVHGDNPEALAVLQQISELCQQN